MALLRVVMINTAQAQVLLQRRGTAARRNTHAVRTYALAMREQRWVLNGVPIIISGTGVLRDGYQRLLACIEAQTSFKTIMIGSAVDGPAAVECNPPVTCVSETISPALAKQYLACSLQKRRVSPARIAALAGDLAQGREIFDAQPICFAHGGRLLRGRHRLRAVIMAGGAAGVAVIRGLDEAAFATYALGAKRRALAKGADSFGDQALAAAMANLLWHHERKTLVMQRAKASAAEIRQIIAEHPQLLVLRSLARRLRQYGRASVMGYAAYVMARDDAALAPLFFAMLEDHAAHQPGHPMRAFGTALQALRRRKAPPETQLATLLAGWERFKLLQSRRAADEIFRNPIGPRAL